MNLRSKLSLCGITLVGLVVLASTGKTQTSTSKGDAALAEAAKANKSLYVVFYRTWDTATAAMAGVVKASVDKNAAQTTWTSVAITDAAEKGMVDKYRVGRAPMPLVLAVHPRGVVTGAYMQKVTEVQLAGCLVSSVKAECMKSLQQEHLVLLCLQTPSQQVVPPAVRQFQTDPAFANRTQVLIAQLGDATEAGFYKELGIDQRGQAPVIVFMAPPGVLVGKYSASTSFSEMAGALHKAGKCCNNPNCPHHHH